MQLREIMTANVVTASADADVLSVAQLMRDRSIGSVVVCDHEGEPAGMVTDRDLRQALFAPAVQAEAEDVREVLEGLSVGDIMTRGVVSIRAATSIRDAARLMHERKLGALPVVERERLVGLLTETDVLGAFQELLGPVRAAAVSP